jgi:hypothetical protein
MEMVTVTNKHMRFNRVTQSIIEYVVATIIVFTATGAMALYVQRAMNVRTRHLAQELNESQR